MLLGKTLCGKVVLDSYNSRTEVDLSHIKEVIKNSSISEVSYATISYKFQKFVGYAVVVSTNQNDEIVYACRLGHKHLSRFVLNKSPERTKFITLQLSRISGTPEEWLLKNSFYGFRLAEIIDSNITAIQKEFWSTHAFCWGYSGVVPETVSKNCPWE